MKRIMMKTMLTAGFFLLVAPAFAQMIEGPCGTSDLPTIRRNTGSYTLRFSLSGAVAGSWSITNAIAFNTATNGVASITTDALTHEGVLTGNIGSGAQASGIQLALNATYPGGTANRNFFLSLIPDAVGEPDIIPCIQEFAFVLDASGSMDEYTTQAGTVTKWSNMLDVVETHWETLRTSPNLTLDEHDPWRIILFEGMNANIVQTGDFAHAPNIATLRSSHVSGGGTPMGGGIQRALQNFLSPPDQAWKQRNIVLLTDGMQNMNPMVFPDAGTGDKLDLNPADFPAGGILGGTFPLMLLPRNVKIFSIGLGALDMGTLSDLNNLSDAYENASSPDLENFFDNTIPTEMADYSPRILDVRRGKMAGGYQPGEETFVVNDSVRSLTLKFVAHEGKFTSALVVVKKNGQAVDIQPVFSNNRMILFNLAFPRDSAITGSATSKGLWTLNFADAQPVGYEATAFVDEENIRARIDFKGSTALYAGDKLPVRLKLTYQRNPINSGVVVRATRLRPGEDLGDLLARTPVSRTSLTSKEAQQSDGHSKILALTLRPDIIGQLQADSNTIVLTPVGNGEYTGEFTGNDVTGSYRIIVEMEGSHPLVGNYQGWQARSVTFDFSRPEEIRLHAQTYRIKGEHQTYRYGLRIAPVNKFGRRIGPAQENRIFVNVNGVRIPVSDNLDGSYTTALLPVSGNTPVTVAVIDPTRPVLVRPLFDLPVAHPFRVSAHGGLTIPYADLHPLYAQGAYGEVDVAYYFNRRWSVELTGGRYKFQPDFHLTGATLFAQYTLPGLLNGGWDIHFAAGAGGYSPENGDFTFGYAGKAGIGYLVGPALDITLDGVFRGLPKPGYAFGTLGIGAHYAF